MKMAMNILAVFCAVLFLNMGSLAAKEKPYAKIAEKLTAEGLSSGESYQILDEFLKAAPSRQSGSAGAQKAVEWAKGRMEKLGLSHVRLEPMNVMKFYDGDSGVDIWRLAKKGAVTIGVQFNVHKYFNYHHVPADTIGTINDRELETGAVAMSLLAYVLAEEGI